MEAAQQMIHGTYICPNGTNKFTQHFMQALKEATSAGWKINANMTHKDFQ
jgi:hypothetical protein